MAREVIFCLDGRVVRGEGEVDVGRPSVADADDTDTSQPFMFNTGCPSPLPNLVCSLF